MNVHEGNGGRRSRSAFLRTDDQLKTAQTIETEQNSLPSFGALEDSRFWWFEMPWIRVGAKTRDNHPISLVLSFQGFGRSPLPAGKIT